MFFLGNGYLNVYYLFCILISTPFFDLNKLRTDATPAPADIMADYYWGSNELRSTPTCGSKALEMLCYSKCENDFICRYNRCICQEKPQVTMRAEDLATLYSYQDNRYTYSKEKDLSNALRQAINQDQTQENLPEDTTSDSPALRHHIAHFCPNLKKARKCIRSCMKLGQPAFCGKDHVCYCGHRYSSHDEKQKIDTGDVYAQFRDLYEKYFGPQILEQAESSEEEGE